MFFSVCISPSYPSKGVVHPCCSTYMFSSLYRSKCSKETCLIFIFFIFCRPCACLELLKSTRSCPSITWGSLPLKTSSTETSYRVHSVEASGSKRTLLDALISAMSDIVFELLREPSEGGYAFNDHVLG